MATTNLSLAQTCAKFAKASAKQRPAIIKAATEQCAKMKPSKRAAWKRAIAYMEAGQLDWVKARVKGAKEAGEVAKALRASDSTAEAPKATRAKKAPAKKAPAKKPAAKAAAPTVEDKVEALQEQMNAFMAMLDKRLG